MPEFRPRFIAQNRARPVGADCAWIAKVGNWYRWGHAAFVHGNNSRGEHDGLRVREDDMTSGYSSRHTLLLATTFATLLALPAAAQTPTPGAAPTPPPSWAQGRPTGEGAMKLAPV